MKSVSATPHLTFPGFSPEPKLIFRFTYHHSIARQWIAGQQLQNYAKHESVLQGGSVPDCWHHQRVALRNIILIILININ